MRNYVFIYFILLTSCMPIKFIDTPASVNTWQPATITSPRLPLTTMLHIICQDTNATNIGLEEPCACKSGYNSLDEGLSCTLKTVPVCQTFTQDLNDKVLLAGDSIGDLTGLNLYMQNDGNLVLYNGYTGFGPAIWTSGTSGCGPNCKTQLQSDGKMVIYDSSHSPVFTTGTTSCSKLRITNCQTPYLQLLGCSDPYPQPLPTPHVANWVYCSSENQFCSFSGVKTVRFGIGGQYVTKNLQGPLMCTVRTFESDPYPGVGKGCEIDMNATDFMKADAPTLLTQTIDPVNLSWIYLPSPTQVVGFAPDNNAAPFDWGYMNSGGAFVEYAINVTTEGNYLIGVATALLGANAFTVTIDGNTVATIFLPPTGSYSNYQGNWTTVPIHFPQGTYRLRFFAPAGMQLNLAAIAFLPFSG